MEKYIEINLGNQIDRYHLDGISVDDFIDNVIKSKGKVTDITKEEYESKKAYEIEMDVEGERLFTLKHYVLKHESEEARKDWIEFVRELRKGK